MKADIVPSQGSNIIQPANLEALLAQIEKYDEKGNVEDQVNEAEDRKGYTAYPHKKETPYFMVSKTTMTYQWRKYIEGVKDYKEMPLIKPCRKYKNADGEDEIVPIDSLVMAGGIIIDARSKAGLSIYDEQTKKTTRICSMLGESKFFPALNETKYLKQLPEDLWPSMNDFDNKAKKPLLTTPHKNVPETVFGEQGNCRTCILNGNSTYTYLKEDGTVKTASCNVRSAAYLYVTHFGVMKFHGAEPKPKNTIIRNFREPGFTGGISEQKKQSLEMYPIETLCDEDGNQLSPFILGIDLPPSCTRGKASQGSVPIANYMNVLKGMRRNGNHAPYMRELYTMVMLNVPEGEDGIIHHFEGFDANGESLYKGTSYNVFSELSDEHKKQIDKVMSDCIHIHSKGRLVPYVTANAMLAWEEAKASDPVEEFDPNELFGESWLKPIDKDTVTASGSAKFIKQDESTKAENYATGVTLNVNSRQVSEDLEEEDSEY